MTQPFSLPFYSFPLHHLLSCTIWQSQQEKIDQTQVFIKQLTNMQEGVDSLFFSVGNLCFPDGHEPCCAKQCVVIMGLILFYSFYKLIRDVLIPCITYMMSMKISLAAMNTVPLICYLTLLPNSFNILCFYPIKFTQIDILYFHSNWTSAFFIKLNLAALHYYLVQDAVWPSGRGQIVNHETGYKRSWF